MLNSVSSKASRGLAQAARGNIRSALALPRSREDKATDLKRGSARSGSSVASSGPEGAGGSGGSAPGASRTTSAAPRSAAPGRNPSPAGLARQTSADGTFDTASKSSGRVLTQPTNIFGSPLPGVVIGRSISNVAGEGSGKGKKDYKPTLLPTGRNPTDLSPYEVEAFLKAKTFDDIPGPTGLHNSIPFAGTRVLFLSYLQSYKLENNAELLNRLQSDYGPIFRLRHGADWIVVIDDVVEMEKVIAATKVEKDRGVSLNKKTNFLTQKPSTIDNPELQSLIAGDGQQMKRFFDEVLKTIDENPEIDANRVKQMSEVAEDFVKLLGKGIGNPKTIQDLCYRVSFESVMAQYLNKRIGLLREEYSEEQQKLVNSYRTEGQCLAEEATGGRLLHRLFEDPFLKRFKEANLVTSGAERLLVQEVLDKVRDPKGAEAKDLGLLTRSLHNHTFSDQNVSQYLHAATQIFGNLTACSMQMLLYQLAINEDVQDKLVASLEKDNFQTTAQVLKSNKYLTNVMREAFRLNFPNATGGSVLLDSNIVLNDYLIPAKTPIHFNTARTARSPLLFDHPLRFRPERWDEAKTNQVPLSATLPVGLAIDPSKLDDNHLIIKPILIQILKNFRVDLPSQYHDKKLETVNTPFLGPKNPLPFTFTPRSGSPLSASISTGTSASKSAGDKGQYDPFK